MLKLPRLLTDRLRNQPGNISMETFTPPRIIDEGTVRHVRDRIVEACEPKAIWLFGSVARAQQRSGSDLDVLVVMDLPAGKTNRDQVRELSDLFSDLLVPMDLLVLTPEQYREGQRLLGHIARIASQEGRCIYG